MNEPIFNDSPKTLEEFLISAEAVQFSEQVRNGQVDPDKQVVLTLELMKDIARRIRHLEHRLYV